MSLAGALILSVSACNKEIIHGPARPDYSDDGTSEFVTFGYTPPTGGHYYEDGITISTGQDFRTPERYKEYKEAGLNTLMFQTEDQYNGEDYQSSNLKRLLGYAEEAGIKKVIICDARIMALSRRDTPLVGEDKEFATQEELNELIASYIAPYADEKLFFGLIIADEPSYKLLPAFGAVYRAIKAFNPDIYIQSNLLPFYNYENVFALYAPPGMFTFAQIEDAYRYYLDQFRENSQADKILMDSYPFLIDGGGNTYIREKYFRGIQILADYCKEHNLRFEGVAQSFGGKVSNRPQWSCPTISSLSWQINSYLGVGMKTIGYFTYWRKVMNSSLPNGEWFNDGESFITNNGTRTQTYYNAQIVNKEIQRMAHVLEHYRYQGMTTYIAAPTIYPSTYASVEDDSFALFTKDKFTQTEGSIAVISELKDEKQDTYMYCVLNGFDPYLRKNPENNLIMDYTIDFGMGYNRADVYYRGHRHTVKLEDGIYRGSLDAGYADYIIPYYAGN